MSDGSTRIYFGAIAAVMALVAVTVIIDGGKTPAPRDNPQRLAGWLDDHPADWVNASKLSGDALESNLPTRFALWRALGLVDETWQPPQPCKADAPHYFITQRATPWPLDLKIGIWFILGSLLPVALTFLFSNRIFQSHRGVGETESKPSQVRMVNRERRIWRLRVDPEWHAEPGRKLWLIVGLTTALGFGGLFTIEPYRAHLSPFVSSLVVLFSLVWALGATMLGVLYPMRIQDFSRFGFTEVMFPDLPAGADD